MIVPCVSRIVKLFFYLISSPNCTAINKEKAYVDVRNCCVVSYIEVVAIFSIICGLLSARKTEIAFNNYC